MTNDYREHFEDNTGIHYRSDESFQIPLPYKQSHTHGSTHTLEANCPRLRVFTLFFHLHTRQATYSMTMHVGYIPRGRKTLTKLWRIYKATPAEFISVQAGLDNVRNDSVVPSNIEEMFALFLPRVYNFGFHRIIVTHWSNRETLYNACMHLFNSYS